MQFRDAARAAGQLGNTALARRSRRYPSAPFARDGYVVREHFVEAEDAAAMHADIARFTDRDVTTTGVAGTFLRDRAKRQSRDLNVRQLTGAQRLSPGIDALFRSGRIEHEIGALTGLALSLGAMTVQIDWPDTESKRGLHVDSHWPATYKTFVYLTPVTSPANGPFSVVPGSHRDRARKVAAIAGSVLARRDPTDMDHAYRLTDARCLLGAPGTAIMADQRLAHAGWPGHTEGTRVMLVAYLYEPGVAPPAFLTPR